MVYNDPDKGDTMTLFNVLFALSLFAPFYIVCLVVRNAMINVVERLFQKETNKMFLARRAAERDELAAQSKMSTTHIVSTIL